MANRYFKQFQGSLETGIVKLYGSVTFGATGAVSSSDCKGFSVAKTGSETGRYTITLEDEYPEFKGCVAIVEGAADAAFSTNGQLCALRNVAMASKTFDVQILDAAGADTNPASGYKLWLEITLKNSEVTY